MIDTAVVGAGLYAPVVEPGGNLLGITSGEYIDYTGPGQSWNMLRQPGQARRLISQTQGLQGKGVTPQGAALNFNIAQLILYIFEHPVIGSCSGSQQWHIRRHLAQHVDQAPVIRTKIVTPVRYTVHLIYNKQSNAIGNRQQQLLDELFIG